MAPNIRDYDAWHAGYARSRACHGGCAPCRATSAEPSTAVSGAGADHQRLRGRRTRPDRRVVWPSRCGPGARDAAGGPHPVIAERARSAAAAAGLGQLVQVRTSDAGVSGTYRDLVPAGLVLLVGIFGNISDADLRTTINASAQLCGLGATLIWSRGRDPETGGDRNTAVRAWFAEAGFSEIGYHTWDSGSLPALGAVRYDGPLEPLELGERWFTFRR